MMFNPIGRTFIRKIIIENQTKVGQKWFNLMHSNQFYLKMKFYHHTRRLRLPLNLLGKFDFNRSWSDISDYVTESYSNFLSFCHKYLNFHIPYPSLNDLANDSSHTNIFPNCYTPPQYVHSACCIIQVGFFVVILFFYKYFKIIVVI